MSVQLTWIGQAGFLVRTRATRLAVLATHQHLDHLDVPALAALLARDDRVRVVVPAPVLPVAPRPGWARTAWSGPSPGGRWWSGT